MFVCLQTAGHVQVLLVFRCFSSFVRRLVHLQAYAHVETCISKVVG